MRFFSYMFMFFSFNIPLASASLDVSSLATIIKERTCQAALTDSGGEPVIVVGLGNYGYDGTRHNVGTDLVTQMAKMLGSTDHEIPEHWATYQAKDEADAIAYMEFSGASTPRREGLTVHYRIGGKFSVPQENSVARKIIFVHPYYDINESGYFLAALVQATQLRPEQIIVVVDDLTLARNQIVLSVGKPDGTGDGHNGLKSINSQLGNGSYSRIRVGISNPKSEKLDINRTDWVLGQLAEDDRTSLFSQDRIENFILLISNLQRRVGHDPKSVQKIVATGSEILKKLNQK